MVKEDKIDRCSICIGKELDRFFNGNTAFARCNSCGFIQKEAAENDIKQNFEDITTHYSFDGTENIYDYLDTETYMGAEKKVLDIGCWDGSLINHIKGDWIKYGVEPNPFAAKKAIRNGVRIYQDQLHNINFKNEQSDLILLNDVIEHLVDPLNDLSRLPELLRPEGKVAIITGNTESIGCRLFKRFWYYYHYKSHISFFNTSNIELLISKIGIRTEKITRVAHHSANIKFLVNRIAKYKYRKIDEGVSGLSQEHNSLPRALVLLSRVLVHRDHMIVTGKKA